jgi:hypothetical protein
MLVNDSSRFTLEQTLLTDEKYTLEETDGPPIMVQPFANAAPINTALPTEESVQFERLETTESMMCGEELSPRSKDLKKIQK